MVRDAVRMTKATPTDRERALAAQLFCQPVIGRWTDYFAQCLADYRQDLDAEWQQRDSAKVEVAQ